MTGYMTWDTIHDFNDIMLKVCSITSLTTMVVLRDVDGPTQHTFPKANGETNLYKYACYKIQFHEKCST